MNKLQETPKVYGENITIVVDEQNDFFPGGSLGVEKADEIIDPTNQLTEWTRENNGHVVLTRDKHNPETTHFAVNGGQWEVHCVKYDDMDVRPQGPEGAALREDLVIMPEDTIASKGMDNNDDGLSGFKATVEPGTGTFWDIVKDLPEQDRTVGNGIDRIVRRNKALGQRTLIDVAGIATDHCVRATVVDTAQATDREWVDVVVAEDAIRAVNLEPDAGDKAIAAMIEAGALAMSTQEITKGGVVIDTSRLER